MADPDEPRDEGEDDGKEEDAPRDSEPWAKTSSGDADSATEADD